MMVMDLLSQARHCFRDENVTRKHSKLYTAHANVRGIVRLRKEVYKTLFLVIQRPDNVFGDNCLRHVEVLILGINVFSPGHVITGDTFLS